MRENKYDDKVFFEKYRNFPRSVKGLEAAGEWHELQRLLPDFAGRRVLDIGCGFGWHCRYAAEQGAALVVGTDISERMLAAARDKTTSPLITYRRVAMEDIEYPENTFDVVVSSLALHYTPDFEAVCRLVGRCLSVGGAFVFSVEHPIFTAAGAQDWAFGPDGEISHWPVDRYFEEGRRETIFLGERVFKYHRTVATYVETLLRSGFAIDHCVEPIPPEAMLAAMPELAVELRRPMMLLLAASKKGS